MGDRAKHLLNAYKGLREVRFVAKTVDSIVQHSKRVSERPNSGRRNRMDGISYSCVVRGQGIEARQFSEGSSAEATRISGTTKITDTVEPPD